MDFSLLEFLQGLFSSEYIDTSSFQAYMHLVHSCLFERTRYGQMKNALHMLIGDFEVPGLACENFVAKSRLLESQSA